MEDMVVHKLVKRLLELTTDLETCEARLAEVEAERNNIANMAAHYRGVLEDYPQWEGSTPIRRLPSEELRDTIAQILDEAQTQLHYRVIYQKLLDIGIHVPGGDPVKNTGAHLSGDPRFVSMGQGEWTLAKWKTSLHELAPATDENKDLPF